MRLIDAFDLAKYCNNLTDKTVDANDIMRFPAALSSDEQKVLKLYRKYHKKALMNPLVIMKPMAWALYQIWREIDVGGANDSDKTNP